MTLVRHSDGREEPFDQAKLPIKPPPQFLRALPKVIAAADITDLLAESLDDSLLAGNIIAKQLQAKCKTTFSEAMVQMPRGILSRSFLQKVLRFKARVDAAVTPDADMSYDLYAMRLLKKSYLLPGETPQFMNMRIAVFLHGDVDGIIRTYDALARGMYTHASPTIFFSGTATPQLASCFLLPVESDSIDGIYNTVKRTALISKNAGGIGINISNVRHRGANIAKTGTASGIVPMCRVFNETAKYVDQCVVPETVVYTVEGPKQIQHLVAGVDRCVTDHGADEVANVLEHAYDGDILVVDTKHSVEPLRVTPEHPMLVIQDDGSSGFKNMRRRLEQGTLRPEWIDAKHVRAKDFVAFPVPAYEKDVGHIDADDCYFYGLVLGDGHIAQDKCYGHITMHASNKSHIKDWLVRYFEKKCIHYAVDVHLNTCRVRWTKSTRLPFKYADAYDTHGEKRVHFKWLQLPVAKAKYIVKGLMDTDGTIGKEIVFDSTSRNLIESMRYMLLRMGALTSGYIRDRRGVSHVTKAGRTITNRKISYCLRVPRTEAVRQLLKLSAAGQFHQFFRHGDFLFGRINDVRRDDGFKGTVYDLQMHKVHRYVTHNGMVHNGGGRRKGSFAMYMEPWHPDIFEFLDLRLQQGNDQQRTRDLFTALWVPDLFLEAVEKDLDWKLIDPRHEELHQAHGRHFNSLYEKADAVRTVKARTIWEKILRSQIETGTPYMLSKSATNRSNMQQNMGTITHSNLCAEIVQFSRPKETAVCVLASIAVPKFVADEGKTFDFEKLEQMAMLVCENLNHVLDRNSYPTPQAKLSADDTRAIGIGQQGLCDALQMLEIPYESKEAVDFSRQVQKAIYYGALRKSCDLAKIHGPYARFQNSPYAAGILHCDFLDDDSVAEDPKWMALRMDIKNCGLRNSLLCANMPTASSSAILGNTESFEPKTSNFYVRRVLSGEFIVENTILKDKINDDQVWQRVRQWLKTHDGSVQGCPDVSERLQRIFKGVYEVRMKWHIDHAAARQPWLDQSQSMNLWLPEASTSKLTAALMYAWKKGLKTLSYYVRVKPKHKLADIAPACVSCSS